VRSGQTEGEGGRGPARRRPDLHGGPSARTQAQELGDLPRTGGGPGENASPVRHARPRKSSPATRGGSAPGAFPIVGGVVHAVRGRLPAQ